IGLLLALSGMSKLVIGTVIATPDTSAHSKHHHYKLIDMGSFGGPASCINEPLNFVPAVNDRGITVGTSSTAASAKSTTNPTAINCSAAPNVYHGFEWQNGRITDLGSLGGANYSSDADSINARGEIEGVSENGQVDPLIGLNQIRAVVWRNGQLTDLGTLG